MFLAVMTVEEQLQAEYGVAVQARVSFYKW